MVAARVAAVERAVVRLVPSPAPQADDGEVSPPLGPQPQPPPLLPRPPAPPAPPPTPAPPPYLPPSPPASPSAAEMFPRQSWVPIGLLLLLTCGIASHPAIALRGLLGLMCRAAATCCGKRGKRGKRCFGCFGGSSGAPSHEVPPSPVPKWKALVGECGGRGYSQLVEEAPDEPVPKLDVEAGGACSCRGASSKLGKLVKRGGAMTDRPRGGCRTVPPPSASQDRAERALMRSQERRGVGPNTPKPSLPIGEPRPTAKTIACALARIPGNQATDPRVAYPLALDELPQPPLAPFQPCRSPASVREAAGERPAWYVTPYRLRYADRAQRAAQQAMYRAVEAMAEADQPARPTSSVSARGARGSARGRPVTGSARGGSSEDLAC